MDVLMRGEMGILGLKLRVKIKITVRWFKKTLKTEYSQISTLMKTLLFFMHLLEYTRLNLRVDLHLAAQLSKLWALGSSTLINWESDLHMEIFLRKFRVNMMPPRKVCFVKHPSLKNLRVNNTHHSNFHAVASFQWLWMVFIIQNAKKTSRSTAMKYIWQALILNVEVYQEAQLSLCLLTLMKSLPRIYTT